MMITVCWLSVAIDAQGQGVKFLSADVEKGIRQHLRIADNEDISFMQLDTITSLNLSKRGIIEIDDLVLLPNLRHLDLNNNMVEDLRPLSVLDSLEWVDLSYNNLKSINQLVYSNAKNMTVNLAYNYIGDFSIFGSITRCNFTLEGTGLQLNESAPFFDVCQLFCDATVSPAVVHGLVRTNMTEAALLMCGESSKEVPADGNYFERALNDYYTETIPVFLNNGILGDSTYLVPSITLEMNPGETLTLPTGLPESYTINLTNTLLGSVVIDGTDLVYTAPDAEVSDTLSFSFYEYGVLKGFSQYYLGKPQWLLGDVNGDKDINVNDVMMIVSHILGTTPSNFIKRNADMDRNESIDVKDVMKVVYIILYNEYPHAPADARHDTGDNILLAANNNGCSICLDGNGSFNVCEMTLSLPEGCILQDASLDNRQPGSHQVMVNKLNDRRYRLVVFAPSDRKTILSEGAMVNLALSGRADGIKVSDIIFCNSQYETFVFSDVMGITTGMDGISASDSKGDTYSIQGIKTTTPKKGVYIKDRKKKAVK